MDKKKNKKINKNKIKKEDLLISEEVITFSDLAYKYQKKLDKLLKNNRNNEVDDLMEDYNEDVEKLFLVDYDNNKHRIIKLKKDKWDNSPHILDLSKLKKAKQKELEDKYKKKLDELNQKKKKLKKIKVKKQGNLGIEENKKVQAKKLKIKKRKFKTNEDFTDKELDEQIVKFSYFKYFWYRNLRYFSFYIKALFIVLLFLFSLIIFVSSNLSKINQAIDYSNLAFNNLINLETDIEEHNWELLKDDFNESSRNFLIAEGKIQQVNPLFALFLNISPYVGQKYRSTKILLDSFSTLNLASAEYIRNLEDSFLNNSDDLSANIKYFLDNLYKSQLLFLQANNNIQNLEVKYVPVDYQDDLVILKQFLASFIQLNQYLLDYKKDILDALALEHDRKYLLLFQNNNELRGSGGFLGSFAFVDIKNAKIKNIEIPSGGFYDFKGQLKKIALPPYPLQRLSDRWYLHDVNYFIDFKKDAEEIEKFLENSDGPSIDGVIAINFSVLEDLMKIIGPIKLDKYNKIFSYENIWLELQKSVELEYDKEENNPKAIIADLFIDLENRILNANLEEKEKIIKLFLKNLHEKNILTYSKNENIENILTAYNIAGRLWNVDKADYFLLSNFNVSAAKTDRFIEQKVERQIFIKNNGKIIESVRIKRYNKADNNELFANVDDYDYIRLYTPKNSRLITASGFSEIDFQDAKDLTMYNYFNKDVLNEMNAKVDDFSKTRIYIEDSKTVFANFVKTELASNSEVNLIYELPYTVDDLKISDNKYKLDFFIQKQSANNFELTNVLVLDSGYHQDKIINNIFNKTINLNADMKSTVWFSKIK